MRLLLAGVGSNKMPRLQSSYLNAYISGKLHTTKTATLSSQKTKSEGKNRSENSICRMKPNPGNVISLNHVRRTRAWERG